MIINHHWEGKISILVMITNIYRIKTRYKKRLAVLDF